MIAGVFFLLLIVVIGGVVAAIVAATRRGSTRDPQSVAGTARRLVVFGLLFVLVTIAAIGVAGLLGRLLGSGNELAGSDVSALARSLAFALIAGPLAGVLWWFLWRSIDEDEERSSLGWTLYLAAMTVGSLITAVSSALITITEAVDGDFEPDALSLALVWGGIWVWHRWMTEHPARGPLSLLDLAPAISTVFGLVLATGGFAAALSALLERAFFNGESALAGTVWWTVAIQGLVWGLGGGAVWWWHWRRVSRVDTVLTDIAVALFGVAGLAALCLAGTGAIIYALLAWLFGEDGGSGLPGAISAAVVGALGWAYHSGVVKNRSLGTQQAARLLLSGMGLVTAASGIGVIVNAALDAVGTPLAGSSPSRLLAGGCAALVVGAPVWWFHWKPTSPVPDEDRSSTGRRIYLVAVFGVSAVVALITLLVIAFQVFEYALQTASAAGSLIDRVRVALGLLVATGLVAGYRYPVW
ncbi:MAG: DUF5671 domain-containing protein, partial [Acidimicrobiia bacterium]|nr:DUF5671 domain-containing protein [Acidimicrobiia bacterium]